MPSFPSLPYGEAPTWCFPVFEVSMYILFAICIFHAAKKNVEAISYLVAGVLFGLLLEYVNVISNMGYTYGKFIVMFGKPPFNIPLCIGVGWGIIIYTARLFTDTLRLSLWASACLDALLALNIDISMDTIAYRLHMWTWNWNGTGLNPLIAQWFGVPYGNFYGWLYVVFFYSLFSRLLEKRLLKSKRKMQTKLAFVPLLSVLLSQAALWITIVEIRNFLHHHAISDGSILLFTLLMLILIIIINQKKKKSSLFHQTIVAWLVPIWFHVFFFIMLFAGGFYKETIWLVVAGAGSFILGLLIHFRNKKANDLANPVQYT